MTSELNNDSNIFRTPATIAKLEGNRLTAIYLHCGGDEAAKTLVKHYADPGKVDALLALGRISSLGEEVGANGPKLAKLVVIRSYLLGGPDVIKALASYGLDHDFIYLFVGDGWMQVTLGSPRHFVPLCPHCASFITGDSCDSEDCYAQEAFGGKR